MNDPLSVAQSLYAAFRSGDREGMLALLAPDMRWIQNEGFPGGGEHAGAAHVVDNVLSQFRRDWTAFRSRVDEWHAAGRVVFAIGAYEGTHARTGRRVEAAFTHVLEVEGGRVVRFRQFADTALLRAAMGAGEATLRP